MALRRVGIPKRRRGADSRRLADDKADNHLHKGVKTIRTIMYNSQRKPLPPRNDRRLVHHLSIESYTLELGWTQMPGPRQGDKNNYLIEPQSPWGQLCRQTKTGHSKIRSM